MFRVLPAAILAVAILAIPCVAQITVTRMLTSGDDVDACGPAPSMKSVFSTQDPRAWVYFQYTGGTAGGVGDVVWINPQGQVYTVFSFQQTAAGGAYCYHYFIAVAGFAPAMQPGTWKVRLLYNHVQIFELPFDIQCGYNIDFPFDRPVLASGESRPFNVATASGCSWTVGSQADWMTLMNPSGTGNGSALVMFMRNDTGAPRATKFIFNGALSDFGVVTQLSGCTFGLNPTSAVAPADGAPAAVNVGAGSAECAWTATSNVPWIAVTAASGTGTGIVNYTVAPNTGPTTRTGTLTIAGLPFTVTQAAPVTTCTFALARSSQTFTAAGDDGFLKITAPPGCIWMALRNASFFTITSTAIGAGDGKVTFNVEPNTGVARSGTISIAGLTFTVAQAAADASVACEVDPGTALPIRAFGRAGLTGDIFINCKGVITSGTVTGDVFVRLNTNISSRKLDAANDTTEALLIVNNPPALSPGVNVFRGRLAGYNAIRFTNVPLIAGSVPQSLRITNMRADAAPFGVLADLTSTPVTATVSISAPTTIPVSSPEVDIALSSLGAVIKIGAATPGPSATLVVPVTFTESEQTAFKPRLATGQDPSSPGTIYASESGFVNTASLGAVTGFATNATRLRVRVSNVPANVFVSAVVNSVENKARLVSADANGAGGNLLSGTSSPIALTGGAGVATWEVVTSNPSLFESITAQLVFDSGGTLAPPNISGVLVEGALAPVSDFGAASATAPIPRFQDPARPQKLINLRTSSRITTPLTRPVAVAAPITNAVTAASNVTFVHTVLNDSEDPATNLVIRDSLPSTLSLISCTASAGGACGAGGNDLSVLFPSLGSGQQATVNVTAQVRPSVPAGTPIEDFVTGTSDLSALDPSSTIASSSFVVSEGCSYTLSRRSATAGAAGDLGRADVITGDACAWIGVSDAAWVTLSSTTQVIGPGTLRYTVAANPTAAPRTANLMIGGVSLTIVQAAAGCVFTPSVPNTTLPPEGGTFSLSVAATAGCAWTAATPAGWITFAGAFSGTGPGAVPFTLSPNTSVLPRTAAITVGGQAVQLAQQRSNTPPPAPTFGDVAVTHPYYDHTSLLKQYAITTGCTATNYCPDDVTTRGQMAVFIIRSLLGDTFPLAVTTPYFTDVPASHVYFKYIQKMRELSITTGCTATLYCPDDPVTRGQMAVFLVRGRLGLPAAQTFAFPANPFFTDVAASHPYFSFIQKMRELSITTGCTAAAYCPDDPTTRGQMAVFLIRAFFTP